MELFSLISAKTGPYSICDCDYYAGYLKNLIYRIISEENELSMWIAFEKNMKDFLMMFTLPDGSYSVESCSRNISSALLRNLEEFRRNGIQLSTLLIDIVSVICLTEADKKCFFSLRDIHDYSLFLRARRETDQFLAAFLILRCKSNFMKLLVIFDSVKSLPADSLIFYEETRRIIHKFM